MIAISRTETAAQAYQRNLTEARRLADLVSDYLTAVELGDARPQDLHWGHCGDMFETVQGLGEIADRLYGTGEYAE